MKNNIQACLFDMDGVLVSTEKYHFLAWKRLAETLGFTIDEDFNENLKGVSRAVCIDLIAKHGNLDLSQDEKNELAAKKNEWFLEYVAEISPKDVLPGVLDFLQELKQKNIKIAVGSASKNAPLLLEKMGIKQMFDAVIDGNIIEKAKPNPEVFLRGAKAVNVVPENCVVFEDAQSGVQAAKSGGMFCVGVGSEEILLQADFCINSFEEMNFTFLQSKLS